MEDFGGFLTKPAFFYSFYSVGGDFFFETKFIKIKNKSQYKNISDGSH